MNIKIKCLIAFSLIAFVFIYFSNTPSHLVNNNSSNEEQSLNRAEAVSSNISFIDKPEDSAPQETRSSILNVSKPLAHQEMSKKESTLEKDIKVNDSTPSEKFISFDEQEVNYEWADNMTYKLNDFFSFNEHLADLNLVDVQCRETLCHLKLSSTEADSIEKAIIIGNELRSDKEWENYSFYLVGQPDENTMTVEIGVN